MNNQMTFSSASSFYNMLGNTGNAHAPWSNADGVMQTTAAPAAAGATTTPAAAAPAADCGCSDTKKMAPYFLAGLVAGGLACYLLTK
jgi:hypothetical protein